MVTNYSCQDNTSNTFQPSLNLDEYVMINMEGTERIYTSDNFIDVQHDYQGQVGYPYVMINLWPQEGTYTHFMLEIKNPTVGVFDETTSNFQFLDYSLDDSYPMIGANCHENSCVGNMQITVHEYGLVGEKLIGEFSGMLANNLTSSALQSFTGEFVVYIDQ